MRRLTLSFLLVFASLAFSTAAPARTRASCAPHSGTVLRAEGRIVIYRTSPRGPGHLRSVYACRAGVGITRLARNGYYEGFAGRRAVAVRGNEVAWVEVIRDDGIDGDLAVLRVNARDLGSKKNRLYARSNGARYAVDGTDISSSALGVPTMVIGANRSVAWIACDMGPSIEENESFDRCAPGPRSVWLAPDGTGMTQPFDAPRELARSWKIKARSLRLDPSGHMLTWREDGQLRRVDI